METHEWSNIFIPEEHTKIFGDALFEILYKSDKFPDRAIKSLLEKPEEASSFLQYILNWTESNYPDIPDNFVGHIYSLILLAHMRQSDAFEQALVLISAVDDVHENLLVDLIERQGGALLASLYDGQLELLLHFIESHDVPLIPRAEAIRALATLYLTKKIPRRELALHFERLIEELVGQDESVLVAVFALVIANLQLDELYERIRCCYRNGQLAEEILSFTHFEDLVASGTPSLSEYYLIGDVYEELSFLFLA